ncbi:MAG: RNA polymerase sigma factor [Oscillospiraceae bacterium]
MQDQEILRLFFERSEQAIAELEKKYGTLCRRIASNILRSEQDAEECVSDAYLAVWNAIPPERPAPLSAYVCRIVRNLAVKRYHANTARKRNSFYDVALEELEECLSAPETAETALSARELTRLLDAFLDTLEERDRFLFVRRYWYADSVAALAADFGISENNASVRLSRLRGKLKSYLRKEGFFL